MAQAATDSGASFVAQHYNAVPEKGLDERTQSRIFYLRNFNNWVKSMLIGTYLEKIRKEKGNTAEIAALDMCCGKGGDLLKWKKGGIAYLVCADIADVSIEQCKARFENMKERNQDERRPEPMFDAEFFVADCTKVRLRQLYSNPKIQFDICSIQFSLHYGFESLLQARCIIRNALECLKPGGFWIGTIPHADAIVNRLRQLGKRELKNDVFSIEFSPEIDPLDESHALPLYGAKYHFNLEEVVNCPEYLVSFPLLVEMAGEHKMKLVYKQTFPDLFDEYAGTYNGKQLLARMQALEPYPADSDISLMGTAELYQYAQSQLELPKQEETGNDTNRRRPTKLGTLSASEWEVAGVYVAFAFQKEDEIEHSGD